MSRFARISIWLAGAILCSQAQAAQSIARVWDEQILSAIRIDTPNPPVHARNLFHVSVAMYDAWAAYDSLAVGYLYHSKHTAGDVAAARKEAISYAAYRILSERYALSRNSATTLPILDAQMASLGYDTKKTNFDTATPSGIGNRVAAMVSGYFFEDGCQQSRGYQDLPASAGGYVPVNPPLDVGTRGTSGTVDPNRWQPLFITNAISQNGIPVTSTQQFVGSPWLAARPYALVRSDPTKPWIDPGPPPRLGGIGDTQFRNEVVDIIRRSSQLTPDDGALVDISPGAFGNNTLGANDGDGHPLNPSTGQSYTTNLVNRGDFARVLAEFWADGPNSETPPGHWNVLANAVSDSSLFVKRLGGVGPVLDDLEWDVKVYFSLNAAVHEAACAAWSLKRFYDGGRPIEWIRYMGGLGQSSQSNSPSYHPLGLPLVPGLIELVTSSSSQPNGRHAGLPVSSVAILSWPGSPADPNNQYSGVKWILAGDWWPYQKRTFVTPAFPGYVSGHSTFSRSAAEVLAAITGSPFFPGGIRSSTISALSFEKGPSAPVTLQWATYFDAADQAGISRLYGGIHVSVDDLSGRRVGSQCGKGVWSLARLYFDGTVTQSPLTLSMQIAKPGQVQVTVGSLRGFFYKLQTTTDLNQPFADDPAGFSQALDGSLVQPVSAFGPRKFYRVIRALAP